MDVLKKAELTGVPTNPTDQEWDVMTKLIPDPDFIPRDKYFVFPAHACNTVPDRDIERFPKGIVKDFVDTAVGRVVLRNHDTKESDGLIFESELNPIDDKELSTMMTNSRYRDTKSILAKAEKDEQGFYKMNIKYFIAAYNDDLMYAVTKIKVGVDRYNSIGFWCPSIQPVKDDNDTELYWEFRNVQGLKSETREVSRVYLGAQYGAQYGKSADGSSLKYIRSAGLPYADIQIIQNRGVREIIQKVDEMISQGIYENFDSTNPVSLAGIRGEISQSVLNEKQMADERIDEIRKLLSMKSTKTISIPRSSVMKEFLIKSIGYKFTADESFNEVIPLIENAVAIHVQKIESEKTGIQTKLDEIKGLFPEMTVEQIKTVKANMDAVMAEMRKEYADNMVLAKMITSEQVEETEKSFVSLDFKAMKGLLETSRAAVKNSKALPEGGFEFDENDDPKEKKQSKSGGTRIL